MPKFILTLLLLSQSIFANTNKNLPIKVSEDKITASPAIEESNTIRALSRFYGTLNFSPLDLLIPSKLGLTVGMLKDKNSTWELEYLRGSLSTPFILKDIGSMTDQRISIIGRSYFSNSFNLGYGISYFNFNIHLGSDILTRLNVPSPSAFEVIDTQSLGFNLSLGNHWALTNHMYFGVDWISWAQPLFNIRQSSAFLSQASDLTDKDTVETAVKLTTYFPRFVLLKLQFGLMF